jgi:hypothetical protein
MSGLLGKRRIVVVVLLIITFLWGCGGGEKKTQNKQPIESGKVGEKPQFAIIEPNDKGEVDQNIITVKGVGAVPGASIIVDVFTDRWYLQDGQFEIDKEGRWTYAPCYLMGKGSFRFHHSIRAKLVKDSKVISTSTIYEVTAPEP